MIKEKKQEKQKRVTTIKEREETKSPYKKNDILRLVLTKLLTRSKHLLNASLAQTACYI